MKIQIESIPSKSQRYETLGDWFFDEAGTLQIKVSNDVPELPSDHHQFLVVIHELVEVWLCKKRGIPQERVDQFDFNFKGEGEPGDDPAAPYRREHRFAMMIEHLMAHELGIAPYGRVE